MKVAVVGPMNPFGVVGGLERLWEGLVATLRARGHEVELLSLPSYEWSFAELVQSYTMFDELPVSEFDVVITDKYPAWMVRHPNHIVYMCHTLRGLYDTYPAGLPLSADPSSSAGRRLAQVIRGVVPGSDAARGRVLSAARDLVEAVEPGHPDLAFPGPLIRELVHFLDADALDPSRVAAHFAVSPTVARRHGYFPSTARVLPIVHPSSLEGLHEGPFESIFTASRLDGAKRVDLLIDALAHVEQPCTLRIAGTGPAEAELRRRAERDPRIVFLGRITDEELIDEYSRALVVPFVPYDEDLGLITLEAQMSSKPVLTCTDSGGVADNVRDGVTGLVVNPEPRALGTALNRLLADPELARSMGAAGRLDAEKVTWDRLVDRLLAPHPPAHRHRPRGRIVALSTYAAEPALHGGQVRINRLYSSLAQQFDVELVALTADPQVQSGRVGRGFYQRIVRPSGQHHQLEGRLTPGAGVPIGDIVATLAAPFDSEMRDAVDAATDGAHAVLLAQPYLFPHIERLPRSMPVVYDSQNCETALKESSYAAGWLGAPLAEAVRRVEAATLGRADLLIAVSDDDATALRGVATSLADVAIVANGADVSKTNFVTGSERAARRAQYLDALRRGGWDHGCTDVALFVGSGHPPNVEAARSILHSARDLPDVLFVLVGSHVGLLGGAAVGHNVLTRGPVAALELELLLSMCTVALNPMQTGSGTNIKMIDYFAAGAPVVSSTIGARGLGARHDVDLLLLDDRGLTAAIRRVTEDPGAAERRATSGRSLARAFDWSALGQQFTRHVAERLTDARSRGTAAPAGAITRR